MIYVAPFQHKIYESVNREAWEEGVGGRFWVIEFVSFQMEGALTIVDHLPEPGALLRTANMASPRIFTTAL